MKNGSHPFERLLGGITTQVRGVLERALEGRELARDELLPLLEARGRDLQALCMVADLAREEDCGDEISYVVNRNINFTNICYVGCAFCGFARHKHDEDAYDRGIDDILERARDGVERGASEVCIQGGIHPNKDGLWYVEILRALKRELPGLHIHAFSPEEIHFGHGRCGGMPLREYLGLMRESGLGTIPGTAAEILDDEVRRALSPRKLMTERWVEVVRTAHEVGLRSSSTLMYGHIEEPHHIARHLEILRDLQKETGGFTEFVPLGFIHHQTRLWHEGRSRAGASMQEDLRLVAAGRLFLRPWIRNVQVSWVKMGFKMAQAGLMSGANDFGGTLMEESISRAAGSQHGDQVSVEELRRLIEEIGRVPYERTTTYGRRQGAAEAAPRSEAQPSEASGRALEGLSLGTGY